MQKTLVGLVVIALLGVGGWYAYTKTAANGASVQPVACTLEAKLCPDGVTYVGRQGPKCEFAACPTATSTPAVTTAQVGINGTINKLGVTITPLSVVEDSRCPTDVQCIQAGTVKVKVSMAGGLGLGSYTPTLELGKPLTTEAETVTLVAVSPAKISTHRISSSEYRFTFQITKRH